MFREDVCQLVRHPSSALLSPLVLVLNRNVNLSENEEQKKLCEDLICWLAMRSQKCFSSRIKGKLRKLNGRFSPPVTSEYTRLSSPFFHSIYLVCHVVRLQLVEPFSRFEGKEAKFSGSPRPLQEKELLSSNWFSPLPLLPFGNLPTFVKIQPKILTFISP